jgi:4-diphosphocytidyl-2-C-methyl-D-erythritol kinase
MGLLEGLDRHGRGNEEKGLLAALQKRIPVGAGLGGGSSDGAATAMALARLFNLSWPHARLAEIASRYGSDLAVFFHGPSSVCTGRGEIVRPIARPTPKFAVLMLPTMHMATPAVYRRFDEMRLGRNEAIERQPDWNRWATLSAAELLPLLVNDLEAPAFSLNPALGAMRDRAEQLAGRIVRMSGSGSSLFTLADDEREAHEIAARLLRGMNIRLENVPLCPEIPQS